MAIRVDGICEYCYRAFVMNENGHIPTGWDVVFGCYVCPEHMKGVVEAGAVAVVKAGAFAYSDDPRSRSNAIIRDVVPAPTAGCQSCRMAPGFHSRSEGFPTGRWTEEEKRESDLAWHRFHDHP